MDQSLPQHLAEAAQWRAGVDLSPAEFDVVVELNTAHDYETAPHRLWESFQTGRATTAVLTVVLAETWRFKLDHCDLPRTAWRTMFAAAPYTNNSRPDQRPRRRLLLYRGARFEHRDGLAWTTEYETAAYFARSRQARGMVGTVWECQVEPDRLHAYIPDEQEYVADVRGLPLTNRGFVPPKRRLVPFLRRR